MLKRAKIQRCCKPFIAVFWGCNCYCFTSCFFAPKWVFKPFDDCVCVYVSFHRRGFSWLKQNNRCIARDQVSDVMLGKLLCFKNICCHVIDSYSRDLQTSNCARVSIKPGKAMISKRQLLKLSKNQW